MYIQQTHNELSVYMTVCNLIAPFVIDCYIKICCIHVNGYWKTNQIVTLGLCHFIGPANNYTHTLPIHSAITRLDCLVCFSKVSFADHVNSQ